MHPSFVEYKMLFTIYIQYLTSTSVYLLKLCTVVKYAVLVTKDLLATLRSTFTVGPGRELGWGPLENPVPPGDLGESPVKTTCLTLLSALTFVSSVY